MCFSSCLIQDKPYPFVNEGLGVREWVAAGTRQVRAKSTVHGHGIGQSTGLIQPGTGRGQELTMSANNPCPRSVHANNHGREQSMSTHRQRPQSSVNRQRPRMWTVRRQSAAMINPHPRTGHARDLSPTVGRQRIICVVASRCPFCRRSISRFTSKLFQPMSSFDPATVRQAVAEFTPLRPQKFQDLIPAKDVIIELRQRRASYRAIATLLTQHCLPTSKTAIATFCHQILGEIVRPHRRPGRKRPASPAEPNGRMASPAQSEPGENRPSQEPPADSNGSGIPQIRSRGPRIAQVRILKPENT